MRVLRIIASVNPQDGGPVSGLQASANEMYHQGGHTTEIVCLDPPDAPWLANVPHKVHALGPAPCRYGYTPRLARWIAAEGKRFDAAVIHGLWNHASIGGWQGLKRAQLPYVLYTHGMMDPWFREAYPLKHWAKQLFWLVQGRALRDASMVLFTSHEELRLAQGVFRGYDFRSRAVAYGVDSPPDSDVAAFRDACPKLRGRPYLLFLSRIHPKKGIDMLIRAYAAWRREAASPSTLPDLVIAGPDQNGQREALLAEATTLGIADSLHWPGMLSGAPKFAAFRGAEAFVLPSHQENFGIVLAEALACGTPVLTTNKVNIWSTLQDCGAGLVESDTEVGIASLLSRWQSLGDAERTAMGAAARCCYETHFTVTAATMDLIAMLKLAMDSE